MPALPVALAGAGAGVVSDKAGAKLYVVGGLKSLDVSAAEPSWWVLDLAKPEAGWTAAPVLPGLGRSIPTTRHSLLSENAPPYPWLVLFSPRCDGRAGA